MKFDPFTGKCYGLDSEMARNYRKYGVYAKDNDPRLNPKAKRWIRRVFSW